MLTQKPPLVLLMCQDSPKIGSTARTNFWRRVKEECVLGVHTACPVGGCIAHAHWMGGSALRLATTSSLPSLFQFLVTWSGSAPQKSMYHCEAESIEINEYSVVDGA